MQTEKNRMNNTGYIFRYFFSKEIFQYICFLFILKIMRLKYTGLLRYFLFSLIFIFSGLSIYAQKGSPFITNYKLKNKYKLHNWFIIQDKDEMMFFANQKGILSFDGSDWDIIATPTMPLTMYSDTTDHKIYAGCVNDIGYIERDTTGSYVYISIINTSVNIGKVIEISSTGKKLIVLSENFITIINTDDYSIIKQISNRKEIGFLKNIITVSDDLFLVSDDNVFYKLKDDSLYYFRIKNKKNIGKILFDFPISKTRSIIGTDANNLYFFGGKSVWKFNIQDQKYLDESILTNAVLLSDKRIVLSTLIGGILIIDTKTRKTIKNINYSSGLPDNEIFAIGKDDNNGLWLSHGLGISRIDFSIPVKFYQTYPGIEGRLLSVINNNNTIYVGTNKNLYFLEELDAYKRAQLIEAKIYTVSKILKNKKELKAKEDSKKKGLFSGLHKKIKEFVSPDNTISLAESKRNALIRKRKLLGLQSVSHSYKKIEGLEDRCKLLVPYGDKLLVGGNNGLYEVAENKAERILEDQYINNIIQAKSNPDMFYVCTNNGLFLLEFIEDDRIITEIEELKSKKVSSVSENDTAVWIGTDENVYLIDLRTKSIASYEIDNKYAEASTVQEFNNNLYVLLPSEVFYYNVKQDRFVVLLSGNFSYIKNQKDVLWLNNNDKWYSAIQPKDYDRANNIYLNLFHDIEYIYVDKLNDTWVIDDDNNLYKINNLNITLYNPKQNVLIKNITNQNDKKFSLNNLILASDENYLRIKFSAPFFLKQEATEYQYFLEGLMKTRSVWGNNPDISFPYIPHGNYTLHVKAKNILGNISEEKKISFSVKAPFWEKDWFLISSALTFFLLIILIIKLRERKLQKNQKILEQKIQERTKTIEEQKNQLAQKNKSIKESIVYAGRIQKAVMPSEELMGKLFNDYFVYFKPRDIVSGDFYWLKKIGDYTVYAVADCTGHGVPGALLSMLGISFLNEIVSKARFDTPDEILNRLRKKIKKSLNQSGSNFESKDGMDIALCIIDHDSLQLQFAGAYNPVYIIRNGELTEIKATRNPIGAFIKEKPFESNNFNLEKDDILYTFSDGYSDQFGKDENQKFNKRNFKKLLTKIYDKPMSEQKEILDDVLKKWKGNADQTDDIIILGVRV